MSNAIDPTGDKFGVAPVGRLLLAVALTVAGVIVVLYARLTPVVARCGGAPMSPGDICERVGRRTPLGGSGGTYELRLADAYRSNLSLQAIGGLIIVASVVFAVLLVIRWQQDRTLRVQMLDTARTPQYIVGRGPTGSALSLLFGSAVTGLGIYALQRGLVGGSEAVTFFLGAAVMGGLGLFLLGSSLPGNGTMLQIFDDGVRATVRRVVAEVPWYEASYVIEPARDRANHNLRIGKGEVWLSGFRTPEPLEKLVQERVFQAKLPLAIAAVERGENVNFGAISVGPDGVTTSGKSFAWTERPAVNLDKGIVSIRPATGLGAGIKLSKVTDYQVLLRLVSGLSRRRR